MMKMLHHRAKNFSATVECQRPSWGVGRLACKDIQNTGEEMMGENLEFSFLGGRGKKIGPIKIESSQEIHIQRDWSFQNWK